MLVEARRHKPFPRPDTWRRTDPQEKLSIEGRVREVVLDFVFKTTPVLSAMVDRGIGREVVGNVLGRKDEDVEIAIDKIAEGIERKVLARSAERNGLPLFVFSEHNHFGIGEMPEVVAALDPIDNSGQYQAGLDTPPYTAISFFDMDGNPIAAATANLVSGHISINLEGKNYQYNPNIRRLIELPPPRKVESIKDPRFVLVTYSGKYKYTAPFNRNFERLDEDRHPDSLRDGIAGAHMYGSKVATGAVSAYIMFNEPVSEVAEGLPFIKSAGYIAASVSLKDGTWKEYRFNPKFYLENPERYNTDRIPLFVVTSSRPLLREIIRYGFTKPFPGWESI